MPRTTTPTGRRLLLALPALGCAAAILWLSTRPAAELPPVGSQTPGFDKLLHLVEYLVFGLLLFLPVADLGHLGIGRFGFVLPPGSAFAALDEAVQTFAPGRSGDVLDVAVDVLGLTLSVVVVLLWERRRIHRKPTAKP